MENGIKDIKKQEVVEYFNEYVASKNIDFLTFDKLGINITMSASMKSLKNAVKDAIDRVSCDLKMIETQEDKEAILVEYKKSLNVSEAVSVVLQVGSYKLRHGKRIFAMAPIHHHFELKGWKETQVIARFWMISLLLAFLGLFLITTA